ncbi:MAG: regulatory protein RecX [Schleiferiaceae bacterium]|nr:regulatory protein RecX [Schleiferiaceae bacterium]
MGLSIRVVDNILSDLILEGYISEERYAKAYVRGKFKIKKWGRIKIKQSLISKRVTFKCIEIGLLEIDEIEYRNCLENLISKRLLISTQKDSKSALLKYFQNRGFENHLILELIQEKVLSPSNKT